MSALATHRPLVRGFRKTYTLVSIYIQETLAYRAGAFIWTLADGQMALILPAVWIAAMGSDVNAIGGRSASEMVTYYLWATLLSQFIVCHLMWDIAFEIREGIFSVYLLRPISVLWTQMARNVGWRVVKVLLFMPIMLAFVLIYRGYLTDLSVHPGLAFWVSLLLAHLLSFFVAWTIALVSLWTTEFISIFRLYYFPEMFLSGRLVPIETMPHWVQSVANLSPFKYTVAFPVSVLMGEVGTEAFTRGVAAQCGWLVVSLLASNALFRAGVRQYTGFGN